MRGPARWRHALQGAALGLVAGLALGLVDGTTHGSLAGESVGARYDALLLIDAACLTGAGLLVGTVWAAAGRSVPRGRWWRTLAATIILLAGLVAAGLNRSGPNDAFSHQFSRSQWLDRPVPVLEAPGDGPPRPVILVTVDTLRADSVAPSRMPALAARATAALRYPRAHSTSTWTLPAMASLLTGRFFPDHGAALRQAGSMVKTGISPDASTLAEQLRDRGYVTVAVTTNPFNGIQYGFDRGFDRFTNLSRRELRAYALRRASLLRPLVPARSDDATQVTDRALDLVDRMASGRFFLWVHYLDPHAPYSSTPADLDPFGSCTLPQCWNQWGEVRQQRLVPSAADRARIRALYDNDLGYLDQQLARLFAGLDAHHLLDRALVVLVADHGEEFWEHGGGEHGHAFWEEVTHVPFLAWVAGRTGGVVDTHVDLAAVSAAVVDWADTGGLGPLAPAAPDRITPIGSVLFEPGGSACTDGRFKAIATGQRTALYDLQADPKERRDVAVEHPDVLQRLAACVAHARDPDQGPAPIEPSAAMRALGYMAPPADRP